MPSDIENRAPSDPFDDQFGQALRRTAGTFQPDSSALVADGHTRGRKLRRRRSAAVTAAVAVVALAGAGGLLAANQGGTGGTDGSQVAAPAQHPTTPPPTAEPTPVQLTAKQVADIFVSLLPRTGHISGVHGRGTEEGIPYAGVVYNDGHGAGAVEVNVGTGGQVAYCPDSDPDPQDSCSMRNVPGGRLLIMKGFEYSDHRVETKDWLVTFTTTAGAQVQISEWNSPQEKDAPITRPNPPLTAQQLTAIVTSSRWQPVIDALPS